MRKIAIIHTGGTIAMAEDQAGSVAPVSDHPLSEHLNELQSKALIEEIFLFDLPSPHMTPVKMLELGQKISQLIETECFDGVIVTHGTDTLEETAYFLDLFLHVGAPIVITGAMRSSNEVGSDGLYNLMSAIRVVCDNEAQNKGIMVVMNDEIHSAAYCTKTSTSNIATFQSPQFGPIGILTKQDVYFYHKWIKHDQIEFDTITKTVPLIKAYAGMDQAFIESICRLPLDGLVIEAFGQGNLPPDIVYPLVKLIKASIPVVIVSRSFMGVVQPTYGYDGGGQQLKERGLFFAKRLSGPKARIKLMALLEAKYNWEQIKDTLET
ncbi:L-asparaginase [Amphibacillus marinus]|uniref:asparaginase n=1 Tax=Amphibacillus marinus TaxID=872970 RepID=A0A1H8GDI3_9BACI|nr:asparaginase [Amphibacillus marinus]SEN42053.1 L-asparaginase [Amphibacillus marinus]